MKAAEYKNFGKRLLDLGMVLLALTLLWPVLLCLAVLVRLKLGAPVFFRQTRPGLHGRPFWLIKFCTIPDAFDAQGNLLPDAGSQTPFSRCLHTTNLDELPKLFKCSVTEYFFTPLILSLIWNWRIIVTPPSCLKGARW